MFAAAGTRLPNMTNMLPITSIATAMSVVLLLSSCGKQEAVGDVPSGEELAKQADAASQVIRDEAAAANKKAEASVTDDAVMTSYANALRGFSIMIPKNWAVDEAASNDDGRTYANETHGASLSVNWNENRENAAWQAAIKKVEGAGENMSGNAVNENEYRATGTTSEGQKSMQRLLRKADGTMVDVVVTYPADKAAEIDAIAGQILASLALQ